MLAISRRHPDGTALSPPQTQTTREAAPSRLVTPGGNLVPIWLQFAEMFRFQTPNCPIVQSLDGSPCFENPAAWTPTPVLFPLPPCR